jgi:hypothetical protein
MYDMPDKTCCIYEYWRIVPVSITISAGTIPKS